MIVTEYRATELLSDAPAYAALRARRRRRVLDSMAVAGVDVLILGRPAEVTYATGLRQLWLAGSRPFGPAAIVVASTGRVHLLATSADGVPDEIEDADLFAMSWNPAKVRAAVAALPGIATARRVATTSFAPGFDRFVSSVAPGAAIVDGAVVLDAARRVKDADEIRCIEIATAAAADALATMRAAVRPGVSERELLARYLGRLAELGAPTPPTEGVVCAISRGDPARLRRVATDRRVEAGDRVVLDVAADAAGYEGGIGTTVVAGDDGAVEASDDPLASRAATMLVSLVDACRPGATGAMLDAAATATGEARPVDPIVTGVGIGVEPPVVAPGIGAGAVLEDHMVLSVSAWVAEAGLGGWYERRLVVVGDEPVVIDPIVGSGARAT